MMELEHVLPADIEKTSFRIIEKELHEMGREIPEDKKHVILRVIHTTADFEYLDTMAFSDEVLQKASDAIRRGAHIVTDTTMAMSGINKRKLASFGGQAHCYIADPDVAEQAKKAGTTRSAAAVDKAIREAEEAGCPLIFAVGNAPTALIALEETRWASSMSLPPRRESWRPVSPSSATAAERAEAMLRPRSATPYFTTYENC